ncbi:MAG: hypothetical protein COB85_01445 [Bacteroidetes bacterium]|nr:MAG: hypothetical protein COB85_01445 [Bacteroidota bacterium]
MFKPDIQKFSEKEWKTMRILFGIFWVHGIVNIITNFSSIPVPRGWALIIDLSFLDTIPGKSIFILVALLSVIFYVKNAKMIYVTGLMFLIGICVHTYQDSQATDIYNEIINLVVLGQFLAFSYCRYFKRSAGEDVVINLVIHNSKQAIIACYLIAAISKLSDAGLSWIIDAPNLSVAIYKMYMHNYVGLLSPELLSTALAYSTFIASHPLLIQVLFAIVLLAELLGIVALVNRQLSVVVGIVLIALHFGIAYFTGIHFDHFVVLLLIFLVNIGYVVNLVLIFSKKVLSSDKSS